MFAELLPRLKNNPMICTQYQDAKIHFEKVLQVFLKI